MDTVRRWAIVSVCLHFIDNDWRLRVFNIGTERDEAEKIDGPRVGRMFQSIVNPIAPTDRAGVVTTDRGSNVVRAFAEHHCGPHWIIRMPCYVHFMQNPLKDSFDANVCLVCFFLFFFKKKKISVVCFCVSFCCQFPSVTSAWAVMPKLFSFKCRNIPSRGKQLLPLCGQCADTRTKPRTSRTSLLSKCKILLQI
jgi:hypothetical protein